MNPQNSQILAMANWPTVDPNDPGAADPQDLANMATGFTYEPGSTFKAFTVAGALEQHLVNPSTPFYLPTEIQVADRTISDAEPRGAETLTVAQILAQSSNVGRGQDRPQARRAALLRLGAAGSGSALRPGSSTRARSRGSCRRPISAATSSPAPSPGRRWATCRSGRGSR